MIYWRVQFRKISLRVKSPNFGYRVYRAHCIIGLSESNLDSFIVLKIILRHLRRPNVFGLVNGA